ncbi:hypothetical protein AAF712_015731 [Marasmius tenuissimus]|uniref:Uncharacterized protein n=1 Tax=Marasmius tenuissimus TaxID=585030 RepID=A0ABR2Z8L7_9AGAR
MSCRQHQSSGSDGDDEDVVPVAVARSHRQNKKRKGKGKSTEEVDSDLEKGTYPWQSQQGQFNGGPLSAAVEEALDEAKEVYRATITTIANEFGVTKNACYRYNQDITVPMPHKPSAWNAFQHSYSQKPGPAEQIKEIGKSKWVKHAAEVYGTHIAQYECDHPNADTTDSKVLGKIFEQEMDEYWGGIEEFVAHAAMQPSFHCYIENIVRQFNMLSRQVYDNWKVHVQGTVFNTSLDGYRRTYSCMWGASDTWRKIMENDKAAIHQHVCTLESWFEVTEQKERGKDEKTSALWTQLKNLTGGDEYKKALAAIFKHDSILVCGTAIAPNSFIKLAFKHHVQITNWPVGRFSQTKNYDHVYFPGEHFLGDKQDKICSYTSYPKDMLAEMVLPWKQWLQNWAEGTLTEMEQESPGHFVISKWPPDQKGNTLFRAGDSPDFDKQWREVLMPSEIDACLAETERQLAAMPPCPLYEDDGNDGLHTPPRASEQRERVPQAPQDSAVTASRPRPLGPHLVVLIPLHHLAIPVLILLSHLVIHTLISNHLETIIYAHVLHLQILEELQPLSLDTLQCLHGMEAHMHQELLDLPVILLPTPQITTCLCHLGGHQQPFYPYGMVDPQAFRPPGIPEENEDGFDGGSGNEVSRVMKRKGDDHGDGKDGKHHKNRQ